ncbi:MAG TPA: 1,2-phenylacetyl-CoA epoxidase subunit PaaD [Bacteroidota bacterium]|nr:1,2-phenylacetyl-CoA epoxidase subunit PaaD [Bacteroidota bacterium]
MSLSRDQRLLQVALNVCRELRKNQTRTEQIMWGGLRAKRFRGKKFLRQHPIFVDAHGKETFYVADFYCHEHRLVIELDGRIHERMKERDELRTAVINDLGIEVMRFRNEEVEMGLSSVLKRLAGKLNSPLTPPLRREGDDFGKSTLTLDSPLFLREGTGLHAVGSRHIGSPQAGESSGLNQPLTESAVWSELAEIQDPEIPVLSLVEMKIIRSVSVENEEVSVVMSPTFVGCPALDHMKDEIRARLKNIGCKEVKIAMTFSPPWSTDMLEEATLEKLRVYGIAPPPRVQQVLTDSLNTPARCPFCGSDHTRMQSAFGATLCKQMYVCENCRQPFERFKPV